MMAAKEVIGNIESERDFLRERVRKLEGRNADWVKRISEAAAAVASVESYYQSEEGMSGEDWIQLSHAAKVMEELERDVRSDLL